MNWTSVSMSEVSSEWMDEVQKREHPHILAASYKAAVQHVLCSSLLCAVRRHGQLSRMYPDTRPLLNFYKGFRCSGNFDHAKGEAKPRVKLWEMLRSRGKRVSGRLLKSVLANSAEAGFALDPFAPLTPLSSLHRTSSLSLLTLDNSVMLR